MKDSQEKYQQRGVIQNLIEQSSNKKMTGWETAFSSVPDICSQCLLPSVGEKAHQEGIGIARQGLHLGSCGIRCSTTQRPQRSSLSHRPYRMVKGSAGHGF